MKSIKKIFIYGTFSLLSAGLMVSCTKTFDEKTVQQTDFNNSAIVQVYVATVNADRNYIYVDANQVNGAKLISGSLFPSVGYGFNVTPGIKSFLVRDTLSATTQLPLTFSQNLHFRQHYTVFMYDTITSPKQKTVQDNIVIPADTTARLRFANFVYSPVAVPAIDVYSARKQTNVFTNVAVTDVTDFIQYASGVTDTFYIRPTGTTTNLQNYTPPTAPATVGTFNDIRLIFTPTQKRNYTIVFRGGFRSAITNIPTVRTLSVFANY